MLRKLSYLALAGFLYLAPVVGSSQSMSDTMKLNRSSTGKTGTTKVMHHKHTGKKHHKMTKKALYKTQKSNSSGY